MIYSPEAQMLPWIFVITVKEAAKIREPSLRLPDTLTAFYFFPVIKHSQCLQARLQRASDSVLNLSSTQVT